MKAIQVMTRQVVTVGPETPLRSALALMIEKHVSGLPVVDEHGRLVGIFTEGDLLHRAETGTGKELRSRWMDFLVGPRQSAAQYVIEHSRRVGDLMTKEVVTATEGMPLADVVKLMQTRHVRRVPVVRSDRLVGIISRQDLMRALADKLAELPIVSMSDAVIEAAIKAELKPQPWVMASNINIAVKDGVVTLEGIIYDDRCRDGLRVAAQNVPGVQKVQDKLLWMDPQGGYMFSPV